MQVLKGELAILMIIVIGGMGRPQPQSARDKLQPGGDIGSQTGNRKTGRTSKMGQSGSGRGCGSRGTGDSGCYLCSS